MHHLSSFIYWDLFVINNDVLRRIRYTFDFSDDKMVAIFALADYTATRAEISAWLREKRWPPART